MLHTQDFHDDWSPVLFEESPLGKLRIVLLSSAQVEISANDNIPTA
jgi:hypothetical protein